MIIFENEGEIDFRTVSTFGCSVKESKNPIGYFGTGLKYALAVLLRHDCKVTIQSGLNQQTATLRKDNLRGKEFQFAFLDEMPLGFTSELGKNWLPWMAYRELHCNAKDEPNSQIYEADSILEAKPNITRVIIEGDCIQKAHQDRNDFILSSAPLFKLGTLEVHARPTRSFFYRGIKVMDFDKPAMFTYNETEPVELTEDRTVKHPSSIMQKIGQRILAFAEGDYLEQVLLAKDTCIEHHVDLNWSYPEPGPNFFPTVERIQRSSLIGLNRSALRLWRDKGGGIISPRRIAVSKVQSVALERAIAFCEKSGFKLRDEYPIIVVETLGEGGTFAVADKKGKQILLTEALFSEMGTKGVALALIEEYLHLKYDFDDCSRQMQNFLFGKIVSLVEEINGEPI